ncbi:MAG TPA: NAD(P)-dependent oxidoreductase, partial [Tepiditoga sp.]|nr:NAD(P)-dependent oxidoreductase [Tepiditoga sp.]
MKVTVTYEIPEIGIEMLQKKFDVEVNRKDRNMTHDELIEAAKTSDGILTVLSDKIDRDVLEAGRGKLKIVSNYAVGFNNIDLETAGKLGIKVSNTPGVLSDTTAELAWALLMSVSRRIAEGDRMVREGKFRGSKPKMLLGSDVYGKTLGIIGMGRIGQAFAKRAEGFGMNILYHNRKQLDKIT